MASPSRRHLQAAPPPQVSSEPAPGPGVNAPSVAVAHTLFPAVSTPARRASSAADSKVLPVEVLQGGGRRRVKQKPARQFRAPIAPMAVKSLGMRLTLSRFGSTYCARVRSLARECHMALPTELPDDITAEIFLRLPPDEPKHLFRASLVCKRWFRLLSDPDFLRQYRAFHRVPPLLGLLHRGNPVPILRRTTAVPLTPDPYFRVALDCHHGRVLVSVDDGYDWYFIVWDPITGDRQRVPDAGINWLVYSAVVVCAVSGCNHLHCQGGPFRVVFIATDEYKDAVKARVYSSETGVWSTPVTLGYGDAVKDGVLGRFYVPYVQPRRGAVIGDEIFFLLRCGNAIVKYDLGNNCLSMINPPSHDACHIALMEMEDGALGFACIQDWNLHLWSRQLSSEEPAVWVQSRVIELKGMIPVANPNDEAVVVGSAEGVGLIFVATGAGLFTSELKSGRVKTVDEPDVYFIVLPYMSFYTLDRARLSLLANAG